MEKEARFYIITAVSVLVLVVCGAVYAMALRQARLIERQVYEEASAVFDQVVLMRRWNAEYGGVYVKKKPGDVSNPYLKNPDITDTKGNVYTLKNPATMTREISRYSMKGNRFTFHITSLTLKNPSNLPDDWERGVLLSFEKGNKEASEITDDAGKPYYRLMRPLYVEESCLGCHKDQGYKVGDVRGGISVTIPYDKYNKAIGANFAGMAALGLLLALVLAGVFYFFVWRLMVRLARQKAELEATNEMKDRLIGVAAHDLRNPLTIVGGYTELLQGITADPAQKDLLDGIRKSSEKMLSLINDILDVSKIKRGRLDLRPEEVDVADFIQESCAANSVIGLKKSVSLEAEVHDGIGTAYFDRERMRQAVDNLVSNAFKYSNPGGRVKLGAARDGRGLRIWVEDRGVGIREDELPLVFDEFARTSSRPTAGESSHGLGLAIAKRVVELHGGDIGVRSRYGEGSVFTITIPFTRP